MTPKPEPDSADERGRDARRRRRPEHRSAGRPDPTPQPRGDAPPRGAAPIKGGTTANSGPAPIDGIDHPQTARELAIDVLLRAQAEGALATDILEARVRQAGVAARERPLAWELVYGIVRRQRTLESLIRPHLARDWDALEPGLRGLLALGTYQLLFLGGIPPHAAVHETVELARRLGADRWTGFTNGVLRSVLRAMTSDVEAVPSAQGVPIAPGEYRRVRTAVFPAPDVDPAGYFARAFSFPDWLSTAWGGRYQREELFRLGFWFNAAAAVTLRVNMLQTTRAACLERLRQGGIAADAGERAEAIVLPAGVKIDDLPGYDDGWFVVQDESAMAAAALLAPQAGERVLDLCAAPGGKTTHLAELARDSASILATDVDPQRLRRVDENRDRLGLRSIATAVIRRDLGDLPPGPFEAILLDVPCSNTGVLGKRPEARWRVRPDDVTELADLQGQLLAAALCRAAARGRVVYSTCSIEPEENQRLVTRVLETHPGWTIAREQTHVPGAPGDGGYQALLVRS